MSNEFDLIVVGGGPAGYCAAIHAARKLKPQGGKTALVVHCPPPHFDGERFRVENALNRGGILFSLTRNPTYAVQKEPREEE